MNNLSPPLKPFNIKTANSESNDLPSYLKSAVYPSYSNSTIISKLPEKKYFPEQSYGISYESPTYFRAKHTLINKNSYKNPYITNPVDYDFTTFTEHGKMENLKKSPQNKLSYTQTFKIGEDPKFFDSKALETTKLPALKTYKLI